MAELDPNLVGNVPELAPAGLFGSGLDPSAARVAEGQRETLDHLAGHPLGASATERILDVLRRALRYEAPGSAPEYIKGAGIASAGGALTATIGNKASSQEFYMIERVAVTPILAACTFALYVVSDAEFAGEGAAPPALSLVDYTPDTSLTPISDNFRKIFVPPRARLVGVWVAAGNAAICTANVQIRRDVMPGGFDVPAGSAY